MGRTATRCIGGDRPAARAAPGGGRGREPIMNSHETYSFQRWKTVRSDLIEKRVRSILWRQIALDYPGVPVGTLYRVYAGQMPRKPSIRRALGLLRPRRPSRTARRKRLWRNPAWRSACVCRGDTYAAWRARNLPALERIVAWAETPRAERENKT